MLSINLIYSCNQRQARMVKAKCGVRGFQDISLHLSWIQMSRRFQPWDILTWAHRPLESSKRIRHPDKITIIHNIVRTEISRMSPLHSDHPRSPPFERHSSQSSIVGHFLVASWHIDEVRLDSSVVVHHKRSADGLRWNDHHDSPWTSRDGWFLAIVLKKYASPKSEVVEIHIPQAPVWKSEAFHCLTSLLHLHRISWLALVRPQGNHNAIRQGLNCALEHYMGQCWINIPTSYSSRSYRKSNIEWE